jgi:L-lactate dehydrogenase complex protein LldF
MSHAVQFNRDARKKAADERHRQVIAKAINSYDVAVNRTKGHFLDWQRGREHCRQRKWEAINHLDRYLEEFERAATARGTVVHWASDAPNARTIVLDLCRAHNVRRVVKSKSMTTEEIHINEHLERHGVRVMETDLGEYIAQLRGEAPYHIVTPVMQLTREDIDQTFHDKLGSPTGSSAEDLTMTARRALREEYLSADMGISGANFVVAETGMISLTENEGNARLSTSLPRIHVAICGIEKVVPTLDDLGLFLPMLAVSGTGQQISCYNTLIGGPRQGREIDGPEEFHVILLDNGRTRLLAEQEFREALHCIRCGACLNGCPVYKTIGGHAYGTTYSGPIGSVITPHLRGLAGWKHLSYATSLCGNCSSVCPVHVPLHDLLLKNRRDAVEEGTNSWIEKLIFQMWALFMRSETAYRLSTVGARLGQKISRALGIEGSSLDPVQGWSKTRATPTIAATTFRQWWDRRQRTAHENENHS